MPHLTVEYSANLETRTNIAGLIRTVHQAALSSGLFAVAAVRTRAERRDVYAIADEHPQNAFVAIAIRIASGRSNEQRERLGDEILAAAGHYLDRDGPHERLALSIEIEEIVDVGARRRNALHALPMGEATPAASKPEAP